MRTFIIAVVLALLFVRSAEAHLPTLVTDSVTVVRNPTVSQAFYGELHGASHTFIIPPEGRYELYVQILLPDIAGVDTTLAAEIQYGDTVLRLTGTGAVWKHFYEPFGGDDYLTGPELTTHVSDTVRITVRNSRNTGKYSIAVGTKESWGISEIASTVSVLPRMKRDFFGKSPWTAFFNLSGAFLLITAGVLVGIGFGIAHFLH